MGARPQRPFVPTHFAIPSPPRGPGFVLTPLRLLHNERDLNAWSSSVNHIHATAGFAGHPWPDEPMTLERNARDLQEHEDDFAHRRGFTYSVPTETGDEVLGCVYIYPSAKSDVEAEVRSWVRATRASLDAPPVRDRVRMAADRVALPHVRLRAARHHRNRSARGRPARHLVGPQLGRHRDGATVR